MDVSVGVYLSLAFLDFLGYHNANRLAGNNTREPPPPGSPPARYGIPQNIRVPAVGKKSLKTGVAGLHGRQDAHGFSAIYSVNPSPGTPARCHYEHITSVFSNFPHITHPCPPPSSSPGHVVALTSAKDSVSS